MVTRYSNTQMAELNAAIQPRLSVVYDRSAALSSKRGWQIVDRAMKKGTVGGDVGTRSRRGGWPGSPRTR
ncbi:hypothetical protein MAUB_58160 [Mycolicibacterium aubagnense]|uniref:Uncharacterized protein n=1 Tax=Mycolicibacterium aubagnense TaxID=319707 RepID=A0ABN5Z1V4_9MYCO|nr:hypothetical protein C1S80_12855 [Mycolicibacterium aubagnense]BBX87943.1 hypothetical protein MAUB_58160 [Mycolicibacterium aubagnense]